MSTDLTPDQEHDFYADPDNQRPEGPAVRRQRMSPPIPVWLPEDLREQVSARAAADDRSISSWIRRAIEHELSREAS